MPELNVIVGLVNVHAGLLGIILSVPLLQRKVEMNRWVGIRIKKAYQSEANWYRINVYGAKWMMAISVLLMLSGLLAFFFPPDTRPVLTHLTWLVPTCLLVLAAADTWRFSRKL